jgi:hypothetical protein
MDAVQSFDLAGPSNGKRLTIILSCKRSFGTPFDTLRMVLTGLQKNQVSKWQMIEAVQVSYNKIGLDKVISESW